MDDCRKCQTFAASPAEPGGLLFLFSRVAKKAIYLGQVEAADAETAIRMAIKKFDIDPSTKTAWRRAGS